MSWMDSPSTGVYRESTKSSSHPAFRTPFEISGSLQASGFQASPAEWPRQARNKGIEHAKDIELSLLLGKKSLTTPGANEARTTGGTQAVAASDTVAGLVELRGEAPLEDLGHHLVAAAEIRMSLARQTAIAGLDHLGRHFDFIVRPVTFCWVNHLRLLC